MRKIEVSSSANSSTLQKHGVYPRLYFMAVFVLAPLPQQPGHSAPSLAGLLSGHRPEDFGPPYSAPGVVVLTLRGQLDARVRWDTSPTPDLIPNFAMKYTRQLFPGWGQWL